MMAATRSSYLPGRADLPSLATPGLSPWLSAVLIHVGVVAALIFGWPTARDLIAKLDPIEVRMIEAARPPEPLRHEPPPPPPPKAPETPPPMVEAPPPQVVAAVAPAPAPMVVPVMAPPPPLTPAPVVAAPAPPAPSAPTEPLIEARFDADYLSNPAPPYPIASRRLGEVGTVHLRVFVSSEGRALRVEIKSSSGFHRLDRSAVETVTSWRFAPAKRGVKTVDSWVVVPIVFSIS